MDALHKELLSTAAENPFSPILYGHPGTRPLRGPVTQFQNNPWMHSTRRNADINYSNNN